MAGVAMPVPLAMMLGILAAVIVAGMPGVINGLLISRLRIPPFIGTLGMFGVARGAAFLLAGGTTVPVRIPGSRCLATAGSTACLISSSSPRSLSW